MSDDSLKFPASEQPAPTRGGARILLVDKDAVFAESIAEFCASEGHDVMTALSSAEALEALANAEHDAEQGHATTFDAALLDLSLHDGEELLRNVHKTYPGTAIIVTTPHGTAESAVEALRLGACDYITKPVVDAELRMSLERAMRQRALLSENQALKTRLTPSNALSSVAGADPRMAQVFELVRAVAPSKTTVLMSGESGTGKSLIAHAIHDHSTRKHKPFVEISCGSIPETLLESELFGHVKGAFTGAHADKTGRFLAANHGTIFLDEINSASPGMQLKLLRVLQERRFEPVGSTQTLEVDVRVILASNQPLEALVASGQFRQDLYYRINVVKIELPPLRDRVGDIEQLADLFLAKHAKELGRQIVGFTSEALHALRRYAYPGNVRELQNIIERAAVLARGQTITLDDLPGHVLAGAVQNDHFDASQGASALRNAVDSAFSGPNRLIGGSSHAPQHVPAFATAATANEQSTLRVNGANENEPWVPMTLEEALREPERRIIIKALQANSWNRQKTSDQLGINRTTLYKKMKSYGLLNDDDRRLVG